MSSTSGVTPYNAARSSQVEDREAIRQAGEAAKTKIGVVGAQVTIAEGAAKEVLGTKATKDYVAQRVVTVGNKAVRDTRCASADAVLNSIKAIEPAKSAESPLVKGAQATLDFAVSTINAVHAARTAVAERVNALPVNLECPGAENTKTEK